MCGMNCKHGLSEEQEFEARHLRRKIESGDNEVIEAIAKLYKEWSKDIKCAPLDYIKAKDKVLYSALMRASNREKILRNIVVF